MSRTRMCLSSTVNYICLIMILLKLKEITPLITSGDTVFGKPSKITMISSPTRSRSDSNTPTPYFFLISPWRTTLEIVVATCAVFPFGRASFFVRDLFGAGGIVKPSSPGSRLMMVAFPISISTVGVPLSEVSTTSAKSFGILFFQDSSDW
ncbi:hypothetical protein EV426DRAFT_603268 [Tirmania nivea]|nr:hypothetical protein EV426DRAFT_603268 [Tirmania nivea]